MVSPYTIEIECVCYCSLFSLICYLLICNNQLSIIYSRHINFETMGLILSKFFSQYFGTKEVRILVLGLDNAGKTSILCRGVFFICTFVLMKM